MGRTSSPRLLSRRHRQRSGPTSPAWTERPPTTSGVPTPRSRRTSTTGLTPPRTSPTPSDATRSSPPLRGPRHQGSACRRSRRAKRSVVASLLRSPWPCLSAGCVEGDRGTDERLERVRVHLLPLTDVDRAPCVPVEARVEELGRVLQRSPLGERELHDGLVRLAGADDPAVRPNRGARVGPFGPLPLLHDFRVCLFDELAHPAQGLPAPVLELGDSLVNQRRCRLALGRNRLCHVLLLTLPDAPPRGIE